MFATPTVVGDSLFVGSCAGVFYSFDRTSGSVRWSYDTATDGEAANFHGDPLVTKDLIIVGTDATNLGHLYAFEHRTGTVRWKTPHGRGVPTDIHLRGSSLYAQTLEGELICVDLATGKSRWSVPAEESDDPPRLRSSLLVSGDRVIFTTRDGGLAAVDASSGESIWRVDLGGQANTRLIRIGKSLFVGTTDEVFLRLDARTGDVLGSYNTGGMPFGTPVAVGESILLLVQPGWLTRLSEHLEIEWVGSADVEISSFRPLVRGDTVLVGDEAGQLYRFRLSDGAPAREATFDGVLRGLGAADGVLYVGTLKGKVYAYRP